MNSQAFFKFYYFITVIPRAIQFEIFPDDEMDLVNRNHSISTISFYILATLLALTFFATCARFLEILNQSSILGCFDLVDNFNRFKRPLPKISPENDNLIFPFFNGFKMIFLLSSMAAHLRLPTNIYQFTFDGYEYFLRNAPQALYITRASVTLMQIPIMLASILYATIFLYLKNKMSKEMRFHEVLAARVSRTLHLIIAFIMLSFSMAKLTDWNLFGPTAEMVLRQERNKCYKFGLDEILHKSNLNLAENQVSIQNIPNLCNMKLFYSVYLLDGFSQPRFS